MERAEETVDIIIPIAIAAGITMVAALCILVCLRRQHKKTKGTLDKVTQGISNEHDSKEKRFKEIHTTLEAMHNTEFTMVVDDPDQDAGPADDQAALLDRAGSGSSSSAATSQRRMTVTFKRATVLPTWELGELAEEESAQKSSLASRKLWQKSSMKTKLFQKTILSPRSILKEATGPPAGSSDRDTLDESAGDQGAARVLRLARLRAEQNNESPMKSPKGRQVESNVLAAVEKLLADHQSNQLKMEPGLTPGDNWNLLQGKFNALKEKHEQEMEDLQDAQQASSAFKLLEAAKRRLKGLPSLDSAGSCSSSSSNITDKQRRLSERGSPERNAPPPPPPPSSLPLTPSHPTVKFQYGV